MSLAALVVVLLAVFAAASSVATGRYLDGAQAEQQATADAADSVTAIADALRAQRDAAAAAAAQLTDSADVPEGVEAATATLAADSGRPVIDDSDDGVAVVAVYDTGRPPTSVQARRDHLAGHLVVPLELATTLQGLLPDEGGLSLSGPDRRVVSLPGERPGSARSHTVALPRDVAPGWTLTVWSTSPHTPAWLWLLAGSYLLAGVLAAAWIAVSDRTSRRRQDELRGLQQASATIANLAIVAQHSLDLGEALPAVTTELSTSLGLRGLTLSAPTPDGDRPIFGWGAPPDAGRSPRGLDEVDAGETLTLPLSRGGRTVATLRVVAGRDLDRHDVATIISAGDLLTSALLNAEAYSRQQDHVTRMQGVDELKSVFLATASHELRTPVVALTGYAGLLAAHWDTLSPTQARSYAERVDKNAQRLSRLVEDLLDFSRLERGQDVEGEVAVIDLGDVVAHVLDDQSDLAPAHRLSHDTTPGLRVRGTRQAVERVVTNLVGNAAKYSPSGTAITVLVRPADGRAELVVDDEGPGIPAAEREQVFSRFYRGQGEAVVRTRGAGLGLAIVTEFAAAMGGEVRVDEGPAGGARFVVSYPIATPSDAPPPAPTPGGAQ